MGAPSTRLEQLIDDPHGLANRFIDEWLSPESYVTARTSGSTGEPKEIHLLKDDMLKSAAATCRFLEYPDRAECSYPFPLIILPVK